MLRKSNPSQVLTPGIPITAQPTQPLHFSPSPPVACCRSVNIFRVEKFNRMVQKSSGDTSRPAFNQATIYLGAT